MFYTYALLSMKDGKFYTGYTNDLRKRFNQHNAGRVFSTISFKPIKTLPISNGETDQKDQINQRK